MDAITWPLEFLEFLRCCRHRGARTLVFGGFAVSMHARPRTTGDLDLWCGMDPANWERVKAALTDFGFDRVRVESLGEPRKDLMIRVGYEPVRIELFTTVAELDFDSCWGRRMEVETDGIPIAFLDLESLIASKAFAGRPQDLADLEQLRRAAGGKPGDDR
jgi:predicted nucleotidyltransferase